MNSNIKYVENRPWLEIIFKNRHTPLIEVKRFRSYNTIHVFYLFYCYFMLLYFNKYIRRKANNPVS